MLKKLSSLLFSRAWGSNNNYLWVTKEGDHLKVKDMTDNHLLNACRCLKPSVLSWTTVERERTRRKLLEKPDKPNKIICDHEAFWDLGQEDWWK